MEKGENMKIVENAIFSKFLQFDIDENIPRFKIWRFSMKSYRFQHLIKTDSKQQT